MIIPLWAIFLGGILVVIIAWKLIKFALKLLLVLVVFFAILIGLDVLGIFNGIQELFASLPAV